MTSTRKAKPRILLVYPPFVPVFNVTESENAEFRFTADGNLRAPLMEEDKQGTQARDGDDTAAPLQAESALLPPLGPLYVAAALLEAGFCVQFVDFEAEPYSSEQMLRLIADKDAVGFTVLTPSRPAVDAMIRDIRSRNPEIPIVVGGPDISFRKALLDGADVAVIGDAAHRVADVFSSLLTEGDLSSCPGIIYRNRKNGDVVRTTGEIPPADLDALPPPARDLANPQGYIMSEKRRGKHRLLGTGLVTTRGCRYRCSFCCVDLLRNQYQERSVDGVLNEIEGIYKKGYRMAMIVDDVFSVNRQRAHAILDGITEKKIDMIFMVHARVDAVDEELLRKMRRAGVRLLMFGLESGNQDVLDYYNKKTTVEENRRAVNLANKCGLYSLGWFILGAPFETEQHVRRTIEFAMELPLEIALFRPLFYVCGSRIWSEAQANGLLAPTDLVCIAGKEKGLGSLPAEEYMKRSLEATQAFLRRPSHLLRVIWKVIRLRDWRFAKWYFRIMFNRGMQGKFTMSGRTGDRSKQTSLA